MVPVSESMTNPSDAVSRSNVLRRKRYCCQDIVSVSSGVNSGDDMIRTTLSIAKMVKKDTRDHSALLGNVARQDVRKALVSAGFIRRVAKSSGPEKKEIRTEQ